MKIEQIGKEMVKQNNRATQYVMFAVEVDVEVPAYWRGDAECVERTEEVDSDLLCDSCAKTYDDEGELVDYCEHCDENAFVYYNIERRLEIESCGVFFTTAACQKHIDENHYHYNNPKVYGIGSWRNPEMQLVQKHLIELAGEKIPNHYL